MSTQVKVTMQRLEAIAIMADVSPAELAQIKDSRAPAIESQESAFNRQFENMYEASSAWNQKLNDRIASLFSRLFTNSGIPARAITVDFRTVTGIMDISFDATSGALAPGLAISQMVVNQMIEAIQKVEQYTAQF